MGLDLYIVPLKRTKEREKFYNRWSVEQISYAKYYEELREEFEDSIEFYIYTEDDNELEELEQERDYNKLDKYWRGFYWLSVRYMYGEKNDYAYAKEQFKKEYELLEEMSKSINTRDERYLFLIRFTACVNVEMKMKYVFNEEEYLRILREYNELEIDEEFYDTQSYGYACDNGYKVLDTFDEILEYRVSDNCLTPVKREHFEYLCKELGNGIKNELGLVNIEEMDFEEYMWFINYSV